MKPLDTPKSEKKPEEVGIIGGAKGTVEIEIKDEPIDFSNVQIEPLFQDQVDFDTFSKSDFRAVKIKNCEAVKKSDKLLKFTLDDGSGTDRIILSGIHEYYEPEELVGKTCVAITNLPPRPMMGIDSCGMLISAVHHENGEERKITFSGDIGNKNQPILKDPQHVKDTEYLVIESTYGDRLHGVDLPDYVTELAKRIQLVLDRGGNMVIPSFAVGRTQEMLYFIREIKERGLVTGHGDFPVYVDSPLAIEATSIFLQCDTEYVDEEMQALIRSGVNPIVFPGLKVAVSQAESQAINEDKTPKVIISASGMCDAGRVRHHLKHNLWRKESMVLFVGYQAVGTLGRLLVDGLKKVKLFNEDIEVNAQIDALPGVSGHADKNGLIDWLRGFEEKPKLVFVNHGDPESADSFTACLNNELGYKAFAPYSGTSFDLLSGEFVTVTKGIPVEKKPAGGRTVSAAFTRLVAAAERLLRLVRGCEGRPNKELARYADQIEAIANKIEK